MLTNYLARTAQLLQSPAAPAALYSTTNLTSWINIARGQLAGEAECIRVQGTISTTIGIRSYEFAGLNVGVAATSGVQGVIHVRSINYTVASGFKRVNPRPWEWFELYHLNNPVPDSGAPTTWAQYGQGASGTGTGSHATGTFWVDPFPNMEFNLLCDCVCYPIALVDDTTVEAIPYLWTDAVPYFAAYLAYLSSQTGSRQADAARMLELYNEFVMRARRFANPAVNRYMYQQAPDIPAYNKIGLQKAAQQ